METGFLTDAEIIGKGTELLGEHFNQAQAEGASYDMSLGEEVYISGEDAPRKLSDTSPYVSLPRGQFALLLTKEYVKIPDDHLALISIKMSKKQLGLINISGFHIDPGFEGKIIFSVFNAGPSEVVLKYGEAVFMIFFYKLGHKVLRPYDKEKKRQTSLPTGLVTSLRGTSASLADVDKRVSRLETMGYVFLALLIALIGTIIGVSLR